MFDLAFPRDLLFTGALFGLAAFVWAGWAHERPPKGVIWRVVLVAIQLAGLALLGFGLPPLVRAWGSATALVPGSPAFVWYVVIAWIEILAIVALSIRFVRTKRAELIAAAAMVVVGVHFVPLGVVLGQPILFVAAVLLTVVGTVSVLPPRPLAAPSFWCGVLGGPVLLAVGATALLAGLGAA
jgi:hypothetical protein